LARRGGGGRTVHRQTGVAKPRIPVGTCRIGGDRQQRNAGKSNNQRPDNNAPASTLHYDWIRRFRKFLDGSLPATDAHHRRHRRRRGFKHYSSRNGFHIIVVGARHLAGITRDRNFILPQTFRDFGFVISGVIISGCFRRITDHVESRHGRRGSSASLIIGRGFRCP